MYRLEHSATTKQRNQNRDSQVWTA